MFKSLLTYILPTNGKKMEALVLTRVREACEYVPYYRDLLKSNGIVIQDFQNLDDYVRYFPRTSAVHYRKILQANKPDYTLDCRFKGQKLLQFRTGGSSGIPATYLRTPYEFQIIHAWKTLLLLMKAGLRPWDRTTAFLPPWELRKEDHILQKLGIFKRYDMSFTDTPEEIFSRIKSDKVNALFGRVSTMRNLARYIADTPQKTLNMKFMLPGAEILDSSTKQLLINVFKPTYFGELYGATETGIIGMRIGENDIDVDYRTVFFCLDDTVVEDGLARGEIAISNLYVASAPLLMVQLGDVVTCRNYDRLYECGASITDIRGRVSEYIEDKFGQKIYSSQFYSWLVNSPLVLQFQVEQTKVGKCEIFVVSKNQQQDSNEIQSILHKQLGKRIEFALRIVPEISIDENGKTRLIINKVKTRSQGSEVVLKKWTESQEHLE